MYLPTLQRSKARSALHKAAKQANRVAESHHVCRGAPIREPVGRLTFTASTAQPNPPCTKAARHVPGIIRTCRSERDNASVLTGLPRSTARLLSRIYRCVLKEAQHVRNDPSAATQASRGCPEPARIMPVVPFCFCNGLVFQFLFLFIAPIFVFVSLSLYTS